MRERQNFADGRIIRHTVVIVTEIAVKLDQVTTGGKYRSSVAGNTMKQIAFLAIVMLAAGFTDVHPHRSTQYRDWLGRIK